MEYYEGNLCIADRDLIADGLVTLESLKKLKIRKCVTVARTAHGAGNYALVVVESLPSKIKAKLKEMYPDRDKMILSARFDKFYAVDQQAAAYYAGYTYGIDKYLPKETQQEYVVNASVLNAILAIMKDTNALRIASGYRRVKWSDMTDAISYYKETKHHTLPDSQSRLHKKVNEYRRNGYAALVSKKYGTQNARKVDFRTERLIVALAVLPNKPFNTNVHEMYQMFVLGELDVFDPETGELLNPDDFTDKNGDPLMLSEATIANYLNQPKNQVLIAAKTDSWTTFMHESRPHVHRMSPEFSFSKISLDDRDLVRKDKSKNRPKAYYAYDVASGAVVGFAYNKKKTTDLVVDCFRDMFRLMDQMGWNCPAEIEVEHHLMEQWKDSFLQAGVMFPFVHFCAPTNSQEKRAEHFNRSKKLTIEHKNHANIGRFYAKLKRYRVESQKVFDAENDTYEDKQYYDWEQLIAEDQADVYEYNHSLHPNQKKYKGMTRWDVLIQCMNPTLKPYNKAMLARYIGEKVETSIRRNSYCRVMYEDWWLSSPQILAKLAPNDYKVTAYYLTDKDGNITDTYIWQNDQYVDKLVNKGRFNEAAAERTDKDDEIRAEQMKYITQFDKMVKEEGIAKVGVMKKAVIEEPDEVEIIDTTLHADVIAPADEDEDDFTQYTASRDAIDSI